MSGGTALGRPGVAPRGCDRCGSVFHDGEAFCPYDGIKLDERRPPRESTEMSGGVGVDPLVGRVLDGRYRLERVLGQGGMGTVYAATRSGDGLPIAVKVLRRVDDDGGTAFRRFEREARAASKLGEAHIVQVYDFATSSEGVAYLVMELLSGEDLGERLQRDVVLPLEVAMPIAVQCCQAVGAAHAVGIVHRDLKPENIYLVTRDGQPDFVKVVDFGLARVTDLEYGTEPGRKLTRTGAIFGTPEYMSPEQCMGRKADHRADVYALGVLIFEMLAGRAPYEDETFMGVLNQHMTAPAPSVVEVNPAAGVPDAVDRVLMACLAKRPEERPQSMGELADRLLVALRMANHNELADRLTGVVTVGPPRVPRTDGRAVAGRPSSRPVSRAASRRPSAPASSGVDPAATTEPFRGADIEAALRPPAVPSFAPPAGAATQIPQSSRSPSGDPDVDGRSPTLFSSAPPQGEGKAPSLAPQEASGAHAMPQAEAAARLGTPLAGPPSGASAALSLPAASSDDAEPRFDAQAYRETDPLVVDRRLETPMAPRPRKPSQEMTALRYSVGALAFLLLGGVLGYVLFLALG
ncbi:MAG: protein kinase [Myxococcota bacterium]